MMTKKILMLGSSIVCSLGICLAALTLTSAAVEKAYANVETPVGRLEHSHLFLKSSFSPMDSWEYFL
ncbi:MAG: hypothetical protein LBT05_12740 [Planctomycetaceae bacterium]|jgi:hypothetical protein|nr:hypothetical protein [Planctomycetaceae bacterium]